MADAIRVVPDNLEATEAWNGPLFDIWIEYRDVAGEGLMGHGEAALAANPPHEGDRVLDIGCGLGDTTVRLAELVGAAGHAHGVDVAERMIETAVAEAAEAGIENVSYAACDVVAWNADYLGPAALNRAWTLVNDVRDSGNEARVAAVSGRGGCHACHTHMSCTTFCPKGLAPTYAIAGLKRAMVARTLGRR